MIHIIPSLLTADGKSFKKQVASLGNSVGMIQVDIADGKFVDNTTWSHDHAADIQQIVPADMDIELHLMVADALIELRNWQAVEQVSRIYVHIESEKNLADIMPTLHAYGWDIGLAINPDTEIDVLDPYLHEVKAVLFMGVTPGQQGQAFQPDILKKITAFRAAGHSHFVAVDGAVNEDTLPDIVAAGVDAVCPGSAIFGNRKKATTNVAAMRKQLKALTA